MRRLIYFTLLSIAGAVIAAELWPRLRTRRARLTLFALGGAAVLTWLLPLVMGYGLHGSVPVIGGPLKEAGSVWIVTATLVTLVGAPFLAMRELGARLTRAKGKGEESVDLSRRNFLTSLGKSIPVAAAATGVTGVVTGSLPFRVKRETVAIKGLPQPLDGFRIGQLTDVHVGAFVSPEDVRRAVEMLDRESVDLQVMTGDLIDDLQGLRETFDALGACRAPHGMLAVYGNHEYWRGLSAIRAEYDRLKAAGRPVKLLVDESHQLLHNGQPLRVVGVDYPFPIMDQKRGMHRSAAKAFAGITPDETVICLTHHPAFFPLASARGARLTLAGHTHGGQVALPLLGIPVLGLVFRYILGRYREGENHLYVSGGTGHWMPFRIGVPAEVTVLTLKAV